jgi:ribosomal protein L15E
MRQGIFDQVQFETRLDVMEISALGRSLDDKRRQRLQKLYDGKSDAFKDKAEQSVSAGFNDRWGIDPVFGKEMSGKVKRTMRDRYLVQSDRRAMEVAYLGRPLSAQQRDAAEAFYEKLSPEQKQAYSQRVKAEFDLTWGNDVPGDKVSGQIKWVLRAQMLEQDFAKQVFRMPELQQAKVQSKGQPGQTDSTLLGGFQQRVQQKSQDLLNRNKQRLNTEQQGYSQDTNPKSSRWQALWQAAHQTRQLETQEQQLELKLQQLVSQRYRVLPRQPGMSNEQYAQAKQVHEGKLNARHIELDQQLRHFHQQRMNLRYAFPALAAVEEKDLQNQDIRSVQQRIPQKFDGIRGDIDRLNGQLTQDPSVGLMLDAVVNQQLAGITDPTQKQKLRQWVKAQQESRQADQLMMGTLAGLSGLAGLGISFTPLAPAAPPLFAQAIVLGAATAVMAIPDLALMNQAAQAGRGGAGQLTNKSPEQALWELALGGAGVTLAAADVGLGAKQMAQLSRTAQELSQSGVTLSQGQWHDGLKAAQEGEGALQQFITGLKNASTAAKDKIRRVLAGSKDPQTEIAGVPRSTFDQADEAKQLGQPMRSQGNNRSSGKGKGKDTPTPQEQSPWRHPLPERLTTPNGNPIPYGFKSFDEYQAYGKFLRTEAPEGTAVFFQGSSVTGRNSKTGAVFDVGRRSDFDVALANQSIFNRAKQLGYKAKDGARIGPLNNDQLARLGLLDYAKKARETSGRTTEFMLFDTSKSARTRPSIEVLLEEEGL